MGDVDQVSNKLAKWAVKEMGFRNSQNKDSNSTKTTMDLSGICLGPLADIWIYVMNHVKDETTVQMIKGNLKLNSRAQIEDPQKLALISQRDKLKQEIAELRKTTTVLHDSLIESKASVQEKERELRNQQLVFRDLKRSSHLLNLVKSNAEADVKSLKQTTSELEKNLKSLTPELENESDLERYKIDVANMCKLMQDSLNELLKEEPNIENVNATKMAVGNSLATLLETLPHSLFMKLIQEQQAAEISSWNRKDFSLPAQTTLALDFIPENVQPLQKLLYELSWYNADIRARAETAMNVALSLKKELAQLTSQTFQRLDILFDGEDNKIATARKLVEMEIQVAKRKGAIEALRKNQDEMENFCTRYEVRQAEIEQKIDTIERNSRLSDHLTALICTLARKRANNPCLVQQLASQSQRIVKEDICGIQNTLSKTIQLSKCNIEKELELYRQVRPSQLFVVNVERKLLPVNRLAVHRLLVTSDSSVSGTHLDITLKHLGLPRTLSVFRVLESVGDKRLQIWKMQQALKWHEARKSEIAEKHGLAWLENGLIHYKELAKKLEDNWNSQESAILPSLDLRRKRMDEATKSIADVETALQEWCDEPAKLIDTGRSVHGKSLEQWNAIWKKSLNMCRKKV